MPLRHGDLAVGGADLVLAGAGGRLARFEGSLAHDVAFPPMAKTDWHFRLSVRLQVD